jgi:hypothetical protein
MSKHYFNLPTIFTFSVGLGLNFSADFFRQTPAIQFSVKALGWAIFAFVIGYKTCTYGKRHKVLCDIGGYMGGFFTIIGVLIAIDTSVAQKGAAFSEQISIVTERFRELYLFGLPETLGAVFGFGIAKRVHDFRTS